MGPFPKIETDHNHRFSLYPYSLPDQNSIPVNKTVGSLIQNDIKGIVRAFVDGLFDYHFNDTFKSSFLEKKKTVQG